MRKILLLIFIIPIYSYGFEVQGYSSGMSKESVKSIASKSFKLIENSDGSIEAQGSGKDGMIFVFCKNKLTNVNIFWDANLKNLVLVANEFQNKYGIASTKSGIQSLNSSGVLYSMDYYWYAGKDTFSILYGTNENGMHNMTVVYSTSSSCWK